MLPAEAILKRGATKVYTVATHGIFAGDAIKVLDESQIEKVIVTNTIPFADIEEHPKFVALSIAQILADAINRITTNRSVSELFTEDDDKKVELSPIEMPAVPA
jgi:ribose-phosphate pyrophosphokinase